VLANNPTLPRDGVPGHLNYPGSASGVHIQNKPEHFLLNAYKECFITRSTITQIVFTLFRSATVHFTLYITSTIYIYIYIHAIIY